MQLAEDEGLSVEKRPIGVEELMSDKFSEMGACGTAVVVTPVNKVIYKDRVAQIGGEGVGPVLKGLYDRIRRIQSGEEEGIIHIHTYIHI